MTEGKPSVEKVITKADFNEKELIRIVASINKQSEHPLAEATVNYAKEQEVKLEEVKHFNAITGKGVSGELSGKKYLIGNEKLMKESGISLDETLMKEVSDIQKQGKTVPFIANEESVIGFVVIADAIKPNSKEAIANLKEQGIAVIMMTGDNANTAKAVAEELELSDYEADCLPEDKLNKVKALQKNGKVVAMAGDGINDAPALALADVGIAMGTGTDVAIESAAITLVKGDLNGIVKAKILSHKVMRNIRQNLFFALGYNALGVPIAAGLLYPFFGVLLSPMIAALANEF